MNVYSSDRLSISRFPSTIQALTQGPAKNTPAPTPCQTAYTDVPPCPPASDSPTHRIVGGQPPQKTGSGGNPVRQTPSIINDHSFNRKAVNNPIPSRSKPFCVTQPTQGPLSAPRKSAHGRNPSAASPWMQGTEPPGPQRPGDDLPHGMPEALRTLTPSGQYRNIVRY